MPWFVNGQPVPEDLIRQEAAQIARHPAWNQITDEAERARRIRDAAERSAHDKILIAQAAAADPRPIDPQLIAEHLPRFRSANGNRAFDEAAARQAVELAVEGGLVVSQLLTLYITPVFYIYTEKFRELGGRRKRKPQAEPERVPA